MDEPCRVFRSELDSWEFGSQANASILAAIEVQSRSHELNDILQSTADRSMLSELSKCDDHARSAAHRLKLSSELSAVQKSA